MQGGKMNIEDLTEAKNLANEHWAWLQTLLERVYKDAFIHGYKHGAQKRRGENK